MNITKLVRLGEQEVSVSISSEDIAVALAEGSGESVLSGINNVGSFLRAISAEQIEAMYPEQRKTIALFLRAQADRYHGWATIADAVKVEEVARG